MDTQAAYGVMRTYFNAPGATLARAGEGDFAACFYRTSDGAKCAVGCLIPDEMYDQDFEEKLVGTLLRISAPLRAHLADVDPVFLRRAQRLHDRHAKDAAKFVELLDLLALAHGLKVVEGPWL